jgi:hypothetical protein
VFTPKAEGYTFFWLVACRRASNRSGQRTCRGPDKVAPQREQSFFPPPELGATADQTFESHRRDHSRPVDVMGPTPPRLTQSSTGFLTGGVAAIRFARTYLNLLAASDRPLAAARATAPRHPDGVPLHRRFRGRRPDGAAEGTLGRNTNLKRAMGQGSRKHSTTSEHAEVDSGRRFPCGIVSVVDVDSATGRDEFPRDGQRGIACVFRRPRHRSDDITGLGNARCHPDLWRVVMNDDIADLRARMPRLAAHDTSRLVGSRPWQCKVTAAGACLPSSSNLQRIAGLRIFSLADVGSESERP